MVIESGNRENLNESYDCEKYRHMLLELQDEENEVPSFY